MLISNVSLSSRISFKKAKSKKPPHMSLWFCNENNVVLILPKTLLQRPPHALLQKSPLPSRSLPPPVHQKVALQSWMYLGFLQI